MNCAVKLSFNEGLNGDPQLANRASPFEPLQLFAEAKRCGKSSKPGWAQDHSFFQKRKSLCAPVIHAHVSGRVIWKFHG